MAGNSVVHFDSQLLDHIKAQRNEEAKSMLNPDLAKSSDDLGTLLHYTAIYGNATISQHLIDIGGIVDALGNSGMTPLIFAVMRHHPDCVKVLLKAKANIDIANNFGKSALQVVFTGQQFELHEISEQFINRVRADATSIEEAVDKLVDAGCTMWHAAQAKDMQLLETLRERVVNANDMIYRRGTGLHAAAEMGKADIAEWLIDNGVDVNALDEDKTTPLFHAALLGHVNTLKCLLERGADANAGNNEFGASPLWAAVTSRLEDQEKSDRHTNCVELLLEYGAVPENPDERYPTMFDVALIFGNFETIKLLTAHLAILDRLGTCDAKSVIICTHEPNREVISEVQKDYEMCQQTLDVAVFETSTLFDLLSDAKDLNRLRKHVHHETFSAEMEKVCTELKLSESYDYYCRTLMKRIAKASRIVVLEDEAIPVICKLFEADYNQCYYFARKVVSYLNERDLEQLIQV